MVHILGYCFLERIFFHQTHGISCVLLIVLISALGVERSDTDDLSQPLKMTTVLKGSMGERLMKDLARVEEKKRARAARQAQVRLIFWIQLIMWTMLLWSTLVSCIFLSPHSTSRLIKQASKFLLTYHISRRCCRQSCFPLPHIDKCMWNQIIVSLYLTLFAI